MKPGDPVLINDGVIALEVVSVDGPRVKIVVMEGSVLSNNKESNLPGSALNVPAMCEKDKGDLRLALRTGRDMVGLSFVRNAADIEDVDKAMDEVGIRVPVISALDKPQAVQAMEEVVVAL
ncbi:pyruvate kinase, partial [Saccharothrix sp. ST-888]|uniref:pyruvate kinase n=1 Tax=Saccharothrix sp. ST-888 TaxID=1427391 RepID=UPI0005EC7950